MRQDLSGRPVVRPHSFHIPVMGTGFTIDTPLKVARYGISSVISLGDDKLVEKIRKYYCGLTHEPYEPILESGKEHRAMRITAYLDLVDRLVRRQIQDIKELPFEEKNDLSVYFELLSDASPLKQEYIRMLATKDKDEKASRQVSLREQVTAGSIDVNIMTKADRENSFKGEKLPREYSDAMAALRGFARSTLRSSVVFSAGLNPYLYSYVAEFDDFFALENGELKKKVTLKVSDFRSASIQAKMFAKKGIWVSEYRIESGLNCGGHAFPTAGHLLGPILEEFKTKKEELVGSLFPYYREALLETAHTPPKAPYSVLVTAQGGVGTAAEHQFLLRYYEVASVGWGSPFLLVPEATAVDEDTLKKLAAADENDIYLSHASPLGVPFYNLRSSASEETRRSRIEAGKPGSPCLSKYLAFNSEYGEPLCVSSSQYQQRKIRELQAEGLPESEFVKKRDLVCEKACICRNLGEGVLLKYGIPDEKKVLTPAVCPGPNLAYFSKICSLKEMIDHIYGRINVLNPAISRSNFLINELKIYLGYLKDFVSTSCAKMTKKEAEYFSEFKKNLLSGIEYYKKLSESLQEESQAARERFVSDLLVLRSQLEDLVLPAALASA